jgi:predicted transcriptional regulator
MEAVSTLELVLLMIVAFLTYQTVRRLNWKTLFKRKETPSQYYVNEHGVWRLELKEESKHLVNAKLFGRRSRFEVIRDILSVCQTPAPKGRIMQMAYLSYYTVSQYLEELKLRGFLNFQNGLYTTTNRGREFLNSLNMVVLQWRNHRGCVVYRY